MDIQDYIDRLFILSPREDQAASRLDIHYAKWVSPLPNELRIDKFMDIPFANITFINAYTIGQSDSGERIIELGVAGFPRLIQASFAALSANEFRFPSKSIDDNIRHVSLEIISNSRLIAMSREMQQFLLRRPLTTFSTQAEAQRQTRMLFLGIRSKIPFKCVSCKRILWIDAAKVPENSTRAKCPSCSSVFELQRPAGYDADLARFLSSRKTGDATTGDILLSGTGEFKRSDMPFQSPNPQLDLSLDELLPTAAPRGEQPSPEAAPAGSPPPTDATSSTGPTGVPEAPSADEGPEIELDDDFFNEILPGGPEAQDTEETPVSSPEETSLEESPVDTPEGLLTHSAQSGEPRLELDDDYFNMILPDTQTAPSPETAAEPPAVPSAPSLEVPAPETSGEDHRTCYVCGADVGGEKICPNCFAEVMTDEIQTIPEVPQEHSGIEIRLKELPEDRPGGEYESAPPPPPGSPESGELPFVSPEAAAPAEIPYWEQKIWSVQIGEETHENLDMPTLEQWILDRNVVETDLVRKGNTRWVEIGTVPYFRTAFAQVKQTIQLGHADASASFFPAGMLKRVVAFIIDQVICGGLFWLGLFIWAAGLAGRQPDFGDFLFLFFGPQMILPFLYLSISNGIFGRSIGKAIFGLAVINQKGRPLGLLKGLLRTLVWMVSFGWGFLFALWDKQKQALHDKAAGSYVIQVE